ncbi:TMV resistance protein N-like [Nymphaea colorata]|nr:TMV resistance protein N-like [Nymphaea colorata]
MEKSWLTRYAQESCSEDGETEASSPQSSSPPSVKEVGFQYDVFLSFRGPDTRKTFTGHLHQALKDNGIITFIDNENLEKGQKVDELFGYIQTSKIFVPIFSKGYADSDWCLKEITEIVKCERLIIPVFFHVEPRDVRHQTGPFESAFKGYHASQEMDTEQVNKWSDALKKAGKVSGYTLAETAGDEAELIRRIVKRLLTEVNKTRLFVTKHPVGLDSRVADVMEVLDIEPHGDARIVGIYAMGGMGKTTLAKAVYNQISSHFEACSFLSNIREAAKQSSGLVSLQKQLLRNIFQDKHVDISCSDEGIGKIKERIRAKKVLLVLDDVDDQSQLDELIGNLNWFCSGSRIIITTRDKGALREHRVNLYELKELDAAQSLQLFSWHAFGKEKPDAKFAELSKEVASIASGLPLALKVFGPLFLGFKTDEEWGTMLTRLKAAQHKGIYEKLKISYDVLEEEEKKVFLDIACFFTGEGREHATLMWEACDLFPETTIEVLMGKCLVSINDFRGEFEMHDHIRDMGRKIVKDESPSNPGMRSRLWKDDEALDVLENNTGTRNVEAIKLQKCASGSLNTKSFATMSQLRMLQLDTVKLEGKYEHLPRTIRWLKWSPEGLDSLPASLQLDNLVVLDLSWSSITRVWNQPTNARIKVFDKLKALDLTGCKNLTTCPDFTSMTHLEILKFVFCGKMRELHSSVGHLKSLTHLDLRYCVSLKQLPQEVWQLTSLESLDFSFCSLTLPSKLGDSKSLLLDKLKVLKMGGRNMVVKCPDFTIMPHLEILRFEHSDITELHPSIGLLECLTHLNLSLCTSLKKLPEEVWQLTSLEILDLSHCNKISTLPSVMGDLKSLRVFFLAGTGIRTLPECICSLLILEELDASNCESLTSLPKSLGKLRSLRKLDLSRTAIEEMPDSFLSLEKLQVLSVDHCNKLKFIPASASICIGSSERQHYSLPQFPPSLTKLIASGCSELEMIADLSNAKQLMELNLSSCHKLVDVPGVEQLTWLKHLKVGGCRSLTNSLRKRLQKANFQHLSEFSISGSRSDGEPSSPSFSFLLPNHFYEGLLLLNVGKDCKGNNGLELHNSTESEGDALPPHRLGRIFIQMDDTQFVFSTLIKEKAFGLFPKATFERDSELMMGLREGRFMRNGEAQMRTMMKMHVSINGRVLLDGGVFTTATSTITTRGHELDDFRQLGDDSIILVAFQMEKRTVYANILYWLLPF